MVSTWMMVFFIAFTNLATSAGSLDAVINAWCLVLLDRRFDKVYMKLCGCFSRKEYIDMLHKRKEIEIKIKTKSKTKRIPLRKLKSNSKSKSKTKSSSTSNQTPQSTASTSPKKQGVLYAATNKLRNKEQELACYIQENSKDINIS